MITTSLNKCLYTSCNKLNLNRAKRVENTGTTSFTTAGKVRLSLHLFPETRKCVSVLIMRVPRISSATLTEVFPCFFLSCKANARVWFAKTGHGQHSSKFVICVVLFVIRVVLLILMFYVLFMCKSVLPPGVNPIAVDKHIDIKYKSVLCADIVMSLYHEIWEVRIVIHSRPQVNCECHWSKCYENRACLTAFRN
jgi:hypothetical protein